MKRLFRSDTVSTGLVSTGLAIFSMFFGAGNVVFPLVLGRYAGDQNLYAITGFLIMAAGVPFLGLVSMVLFNGDYNQFFGRLGKVASMAVVVASMALIGPFAAIPRCIALSYTTVKGFLPGTTLFYFSLISCVIIFLFSYKKSNVVDIIGKILSPILLISLIIIIIKGLWSAPEALAVYGKRRIFLFEGLVEGYNTMDIFAGFFFSGVVIAGIRQRLIGSGEVSSKQLIGGALRAGAIGISLLGLIYTGFSYVSAAFGERLAAVDPDALISAIAFYTLGQYAGILACVAVSLACLTTAIALAVVFSDFVRSQVLSNRITYKSTLLMTMVVAFAVSNIGFAGIVRMISPVLSVCYPALIVLAVVNLAHKLWGFRPVKVPVFGTFVVVLAYHLFKAWF
ncbi:branched-chain amino acid transport system II carrier protein [Candidatus Babeliales bacterium]|nr:branched-chain amino acid transport system II carrier protein [Candidatus Babeliales bacterium]